MIPQNMERAKMFGTEWVWKAYVSEDIHCNATCNDKNCGICT